MVKTWTHGATRVRLLDTRHVQLLYARHPHWSGRLAPAAGEEGLIVNEEEKPGGYGIALMVLFDSGVRALAPPEALEEIL